ncbi:MAG: FGGY-family carbohydrate kinase [Chloroflexia bacterium]|nr:FGGY-family carbohydrate kinase [Chloroflexia bacterium]
MSGSLLLGVDIGTSSSKGVLCDPEGTVLATAVIEHETSFPRAGWAEHDADGIWWSDFIAITRQILAGQYHGADVGAVAVSAIGPCMLPMDATGRPLRPAVLYGIDTRATAEIDLLNRQIGPEAIFNLCGMALNSQTIGPKILWLRRNEPELFERTAMIHSSSDYVVFKLTGEHLIDRHTASYFAPLFNMTTLEWDSRSAEHMIDLEKLPRLGDASDIAGGVTSQASAETGLAIGTPVTVGTIDAAAEAVSVGVQNPGDTMIMYGSTMFFLGTVEAPRPDRRMWTTAHPLPKRRAVTCGMATSGLITSWFCDVITPGSRLVDHSTTYANLIADATATPAGAEGLICLPYFAGERTPIHDPDARGVFAGLTLRHTRAHLFRSILEGIAFGARHNLDVMTEMEAAPRRLIAVGGGTRNPLWMQVVSDITGIEQLVPERTIGASLGDAFMAGLGSGLISGLDVLSKEWVRIVNQIDPNPAVKSRYDDLYETYLDLYAASKSSVHRLAKIAADSYT